MRILWAIGILSLASLAGCRSAPVPTQNQSVPPPRQGQYNAGGNPNFSEKPSMQKSGVYNMSAPIRPNSQITPGAVLEVTPQDFCTPGYSKKVRNVPSSVKKQAYANYGITRRARGEYEVDHLISLQLGGSNSIRNLWPQSEKTQPWNARVKNVLENKLHSLICSGKVDAATAQREIAQDWIAAYQKYVGPTPQEAADASGETDSEVSGRNVSEAVQAAPSGGAGQVWVNLNSGKYFVPGDRYFGKTKRGVYMSEAQAQSQGYQKAGGR